MSDALGGLDDPCAACGRDVGDHTMREWAACMGDHWENPYHDLAGAQRAAKVTSELRERFNLPADAVLADTIQAKALVIRSDPAAQKINLPGMTLSRGTSPVNVAVPALLHEFQMGLPGGPAGVVKVLYSSTPEVMRKYGRLIRDTANGAANAAERAR